MKHLKLKIFFASLFTYGVLVQSCSSQSTCPPCPARVNVNPNINFRVVDKSSNKDLFFDTTPTYSFNEIKAFHLTNGKPSLLTLIKDNERHSFNLNVPTIHSSDTITIQIASLNTDTILFKTSTTDKCCPVTVLNSVTFNSVPIFAAGDTTTIIILKK